MLWIEIMLGSLCWSSLWLQNNNPYLKKDFRSWWEQHQKHAALLRSQYPGSIVTSFAARLIGFWHACWMRLLPHKQAEHYLYNCEAACLYYYDQALQVNKQPPERLTVLKQCRQHYTNRDIVPIEPTGSIQMSMVWLSKHRL